MIIDSHAHLDDEQFQDDLDEVVDRAFEVGVGCIVNSACNVATSKAAIANAERWDKVYATVGIHPHDADEVDPQYLDTLDQYLRHPKVVALGEIGLDYYRDISPRDVQKKVFGEQMELAKELKVPVVIHAREACKDLFDVLKRYSDSVPVKVMHCYSGSVEMLREFLSIGCYISVGGPVTYKNSRKLPEVIEEVPIDRLMVETDCPYLPPEPHRGKRNEPSYVTLVVEKIARIRGEDASYIAYNTSVNTIRAFGLEEKGLEIEV